MSGELEETIEHSYIISSSREEIDALYETLNNNEDVEIQHRYSFIPAIAAKIEDESLVERLIEDGYRVEKQNKMESTHPSSHSLQ